MDGETEQFTINVRSIISMYENRTVSAERPSEIKRAKSLGNLIRKKSIYDLIVGRNFEQIRNDLMHLHNDLNNYKVYRKNDHIFYHNRLFQLIIDVINTDSMDAAKKHELIDLIRELCKLLNELLPSDHNGVGRGIQLKAVPFKRPNYDVKDDDEGSVVSGSSELMPSFQRLRSLFEQRSTSNTGLDVISMEERTPGLTPLGHRYVSYQELPVNK